MKKLVLLLLLPLLSLTAFAEDQVTTETLLKEYREQINYYHDKIQAGERNEIIENREAIVEKINESKRLYKEESYPNDIRSDFALANAAFNNILREGLESRRYAKPAFRSLQRAHEFNPNNALALFRLAETFIRISELKESKQEEASRSLRIDLKLEIETTIEKLNAIEVDQELEEEKNDLIQQLEQALVL